MINHNTLHHSSSLSPLLVLGRRHPTPIHHCSILIKQSQVHTSVTGHIRGVLVQTEDEGPHSLAFIHAFFA
ncbi:hypothetical protein HanPI659440_Chr09g0337031 [Helianthus annuus]|nr:hypothetical protein HanPI659440_Chr09g0337031 [Helianthus annuus]